jgi:hypothetical protein
MNTTKTLPTKETIKVKFYTNKYLKAQKNIILLDSLLTGLVILGGAIITNFLF